jgi:hypothetical protein
MQSFFIFTPALKSGRFRIGDENCQVIRSGNPLVTEMGIADFWQNYIPAGKTDYWQPLDRKIFGNLKSRAKACFNGAHCGWEIPRLDLIWAVKCLLGQSKDCFPL